MKEHVSIVIVTLILVLARLVGMFLMAIGSCEQCVALAYQLTREKRQEPKRMAGFSFSRIEKKPFIFSFNVQYSELDDAIRGALGVPFRPKVARSIDGAVHAP